ncbi:MAG: hypothetical protein RRB13_08120 [bacterium]|nr:hypothetical protein [bacterium]
MRNWWLAIFFLIWAQLAWADCRTCHKLSWPTPAHAQTACVACHQGQAQATTEAEAHQGLLSSPGQPEGRGCGAADCHKKEVAQHSGNLMNHASGLIETTQRAFGEPPQAKSAAQLGHQGAESYLRKLCISCHLGTVLDSSQPVLAWRGGACLACHLGEAKAGVHRSLDLPRDNRRCFGCHSRSGRIALSYAGLAERAAPQPGSVYLFDGRPVTKETPDVHSRAGLLCTDCHTRRGVMGDGSAKAKGEQREIACLDCHGVERQPPFTAQRFGSPLHNLRQKAGRRFLKPKAQGGMLAVPLVDAEHQTPNHQRLSCDACHAGWAPQCYGCHLDYDPKGQQFDHAQGKITPGRWVETGWDYQAKLPALGWYQGQVTPFVPGMIWTRQTPKGPQSASIYAPLSPHTTTGARSCASCHQNPAAWGKVPGTSASPQGGWGLPRAWGPQKGPETLHLQARKFNEFEVGKFERVGGCLECHGEKSPIYQNFSTSLKRASTPQHRDVAEKKGPVAKSGN